MNMKRILILLLGLFSVAYGQFSPTSAKTKFVNGISIGSKDSTYFTNAGDTIVLYFGRDSAVYARFKGIHRRLAYAGGTDFVPYTGAVTNVNLGNYRLTARSIKTDSIYANSSAGMYLTTNTGTAVAHWGGGGSVEVDFKGFAGYDANRASSYTARSFTDKNYVDSSASLRVRYTDTAAMLSPYLRITDSTGLLSQVVRTFGTQTIGGNKTFSNDIVVNGLTVGRGGGNSNSNTSFGLDALKNNISIGLGNTAIGSEALITSTLSSNNTAIGNGSLYSHTSGDGRNTAVGRNSLFSNTTGTNNTAIGFQAGFGSGSNGNTTGSNNSYFGYNSVGSAVGNSNETVIGASAIGNGSNTVTIGNSSVTNNYFTGNIRGGAFIRSGGTSSQFLKADGSVDGTSYATAASLSGYLPLSGGTLTGALSGTSATFSGALSAKSATITETTSNTYGSIAVVGNSRGGSVDFYANSTSVGGIYADASANLYLYSGNSFANRLTIASTGAATFSSSVTAGGNITSGTGAFDTGGFFIPYSSASTSSRNWKITNDQVAFGDFSIKQSSTQTGLPDTYRLYISPSGDVGIGTTSPLSALHVVGESRVYTGTNLGYWGVDAGNSYVYFGTNSSGFGLSLQTSGSERMRITSGGDVLINTTTTDGTNKLIVNGNARIDGSVTASGAFKRAYTTGGSNASPVYENAYTYTAGDIAYGAIQFRNTYNDNTFTGFRLRLTGGGGTYNALEILPDGAATFSSSVTATGFIVSSDRRLKNIIKRDGDVAYYKWKDKQDDKVHIGYIAQEVQKTNPDQVSENNGKLAVNYIEILVEKVRALEKEIEQLKRKKK